VPGGVQRNVAVALEPVLGVPGGPPVPPEQQPDDLGRGAFWPEASLAVRHDQRGPRPGEPGAPGRADPPAMAGSGSGIRGQSFQSRSSA
jgi:hypothetical protein